jgi:hypothetical protein
VTIISVLMSIAVTEDAHLKNGEDHHDYNNVFGSYHSGVIFMLFKVNLSISLHLTLLESIGQIDG